MTEQRKFVIVTWPESQELEEYEGFKENCCLINDFDEEGGYSWLDDYGSSTFFVDEEWYNDPHKVYIGAESL